MTSEWLTTAEALELLGLRTRQALAHLRRRGIFRLGVHYTRPTGMRIRWRRSALEAHLAGHSPAPRATSRRRSKLAPHLMPDFGVVDSALPTPSPFPSAAPDGGAIMQTERQGPRAQRPEVHSEEDQRIGAAMRSERERRGLSVAEVAARASYRVDQVEALEAGYDCWSADHLRELAGAYGVGVVEAFILGGLLTIDDVNAWRPTP